MTDLPAPLTVRRRWTVIAVTIVAAVLAGLLGGDVADSLSSGGFDDPSSESARADTVLEERFDAGDPDLVMLVSTAAGNVDDAAVTAAGTELTDRLAAEPGVVEVASYWSLGAPPPLRSEGGDRALVLVRLEGTQDEVLHLAGELRDTYEGPIPGTDLEVAIGGEAATFSQVNEVIEEDLVTAELIAFPVTLVLLILIFGSVVAALLPLLIGGLAIVGTFAALQVVAATTEVSIFALNFTTAIGLGLAIDYSLLVVSRYREELAAGYEVSDAIRRTLATAGRTVAFSGGTVASALVALLVFEQAFLRSFAYAGIAVVGLAVLAATVVLPAVLAALGHRIDRLRVRRIRPAAADGTGVWSRIAHFVMRRPVPVATAAIVLLAVLGAPFLGVELGFPDDRVLPEDASTRVVGDVLRDEFPSNEARPTTVVLTGAEPADDELSGYAAELSRIAGVARVDTATGSYVGGRQVAPPGPFNTRYAAGGARFLDVVPAVEPISPAGEDMVGAVRDVSAPGGEVLVGGPSAELVDGKAGMLARLPWALGLIALITFVVLFLSFGSVVLPLKAIVLNLLSLSATFGALVWVFQDGNLSGLLGFTATGTLTITMPVLMFVVAFGLSMDYEVFLLSRIREEWDATGDDRAAVARGLERTGRIITAAAVLIAVVFVAFSVSRVSFMIMFGLGMTLAVLVDAFIVRATLVPAFMRLAGRWNWWAPPSLRRLHDRIGFRESTLDPDEPAPVSTPVSS